MSKLNHDETDARLLSALMDLLENENLYAVQVSELCARAKVNRTTFYKHYDGISEYVRSIEEDFIADMNRAFYFGNVFMHAIDIDAYQTFLQCVAFMKAHRPVAKALFGPNGSASFKSSILKMWANQVEEAVLIKNPRIQEKLNLEMLSTCVASSMVGLLELALNSPDKYSDEYFALQMTALVYERMLAVS